MSNHQTFFRPIHRIGAIALLTLAAVTNSFANDSDRITQLENEVQQLKLRLNNLEDSKGSSIAPPKTVATTEGWKQLANWRSLTKGMSPNEVRLVLGEPVTVRASGPFTDWKYSNRGAVTFYDERLHGWTEPS
jgi:hypothetical protein